MPFNKYISMKKSVSLYSLSAILVLLAFSSCVKNEFDAPVTTNEDPDLAVSMTISELRAMGSSTLPVLISTNEVIAGIVTADDFSGNFYKAMTIQDSTGAISVLLDQSNFNSFYPIGRRVFIKCQDLYVADDGDGNFLLGIESANTIGRIPSGLVSKYIIGGEWGIKVEPINVTLNDLATVPSQMLVKISDVQFADADTAQTYANPTTQQSMNREVDDCNGNFVDLYSSGYAYFAGALTPSGKGSITAINLLYSGDPELIIRDVNDVDMTGPRCGSSSGVTIMKTIQEIKDTASTGTIILPVGWTIRGTVISDVAAGNITAKNIAVQDGLSGIIVRFTANNSILQLNDSVQIEVGGCELYYYNGLLEIDLVPNIRATTLGTGTIIPMAVTIPQIVANVDAYQSTIVKLTGVTITGAPTFSGNTVITQGVETMGMYTSSFANFSGNALPAGTVDLVGLVNVQNSTAELKMRNASDVQ
jgi:hypothetical protein